MPFVSVVSVFRVCVWRVGAGEGGGFLEIIKKGEIVKIGGGGGELYY